MQTGINFSHQVKEILNRNNIQIRSLQFIDDKIKEELFRHRKKVILLIRNKVFECEINSRDHLTLDVFDTKLTPYLKKSQLVLVVIPTGGSKRYVLQTYIDNIFIDRFRLIALDPRNTKRFSFSQPIKARVRPICDATVIRIQTGELQLIRHTQGIFPDADLDIPNKTSKPAADNQDEKNIQLEVEINEGQTPNATIIETTSASTSRINLATIRDILYKDKDQEDTQSEDFIRLEGQPPIDATLLDISCGGLCLLYKERHDNNFSVDQLLAIECTFDKTTSSPGVSEQLTFFIFAIARNIKEIEAALQLHLQFLAKLPKTAQQYW